MKEHTYKLVRNGIWALALTGSVAVGSTSAYLSIKNTNEHYVANREADIAKIQAIDALISNPAYAAYIDKRQQIATAIESSFFLPVGYQTLTHRIEAITGPFAFPKK